MKCKVHIVIEAAVLLLVKSIQRKCVCKDADFAALFVGIKKTINCQNAHQEGNSCKLKRINCIYMN